MDHNKEYLSLMRLFTSDWGKKGLEIYPGATVYSVVLSALLQHRWWVEEAMESQERNSKASLGSQLRRDAHTLFQICQRKGGGILKREKKMCALEASRGC